MYGSQGPSFHRPAGAPGTAALRRAVRDGVRGSVFHQGGTGHLAHLQRALCHRRHLRPLGGHHHHPYELSVRTDQIGILRRRYDWFQLLQFPAAIVFGLTIDAAEAALAGVIPGSYPAQWLLCAAGIFLIAFGISMEVTAGLVTTAGEGIVLAICRVAPVKFSNMKVAFDVTLVCLAVALSLIFLGRPEGVREGTLAAAVCVGLVTRQTNKIMKKAEAVILP